MTPSSSPPHEGEKKFGKWKKLSSKYVYQSPWIKVREDQVIRPDGNEGIYNIVEQDDGVCVIPISEQGKIWMVKNYRYIYDELHWELVCGGVEANETHQQAAHRELVEELKMDATELKSIGRFRPSNGKFKHETEFFVARNLKPQKPLEEDWDVEDRKAFSLNEIDEMISRGEILDGYVMAAMYFYKLSLNSTPREEGKEMS